MNGMLGLVTRPGLRRRLAVGISTVLVGSLLPVLPGVAGPAAAAGTAAHADVGKAVPGAFGARVRPRKLSAGPRTPAERPKARLARGRHGNDPPDRARYLVAVGHGAREG